jgi:hypothetical protein
MSSNMFCAVGDVSSYRCEKAAMREDADPAEKRALSISGAPFP